MHDTTVDSIPRAMMAAFPKVKVISGCRERTCSHFFYFLRPAQARRVVGRRALSPPCGLRDRAAQGLLCTASRAQRGMGTLRLRERDGLGCVRTGSPGQEARAAGRERLAIQRIRNAPEIGVLAVLGGVAPPFSGRAVRRVQHRTPQQPRRLGIAARQRLPRSHTDRHDMCANNSNSTRPPTPPPTPPRSFRGADSLRAAKARSTRTVQTSNDDCAHGPGARRHQQGTLLLEYYDQTQIYHIWPESRQLLEEFFWRRSRPGAAH